MLISVSSPEGDIGRLVVAEYGPDASFGTMSSGDWIGSASSSSSSSSVANIPFAMLIGFGTVGGGPKALAIIDSQVSVVLVNPNSLAIDLSTVETESGIGEGDLLVKARSFNDDRFVLVSILRFVIGGRGCLSGIAWPVAPCLCWAEPGSARGSLLVEATLEAPSVVDLGSGSYGGVEGALDGALLKFLGFEVAFGTAEDTGRGEARENALGTFGKLEPLPGADDVLPLVDPSEVNGRDDGPVCEVLAVMAASGIRKSVALKRKGGSGAEMSRLDVLLEVETSLVAFIFQSVCPITPVSVVDKGVGSVCRLAIGGSRPDCTGFGEGVEGEEKRELSVDSSDSKGLFGPFLTGDVSSLISVGAFATGDFG